MKSMGTAQSLHRHEIKISLPVTAGLKITESTTAMELADLNHLEYQK